MNILKRYKKIGQSVACECVTDPFQVTRVIFKYPSY